MINYLHPILFFNTLAAWIMSFVLMHWSPVWNECPADLQNCCYCDPDYAKIVQNCCCWDIVIDSWSWLLIVSNSLKNPLLLLVNMIQNLLTICTMATLWKCISISLTIHRNQFSIWMSVDVKDLTHLYRRLAITSSKYYPSCTFEHTGPHISVIAQVQYWSFSIVFFLPVHAIHICASSKLQIALFCQMHNFVWLHWLAPKSLL